ncbi:conjugative transposon protein TraM [Xanthocytophaga agilis]|uniref:Conjugative transposon protein TraM n=1 Tax=Xanthocytophaga agilis TaxID=3048010 RepID=A0AAE3UIC7_9BACT|nr:conjugative transposon protein TraM [Xanthocytophaga agilis]MDJ1505231.1 conjugative transposon protein TraM [Xanthocytophaga agilis]
MSDKEQVTKEHITNSESDSPEYSQQETPNPKSMTEQTTDEFRETETDDENDWNDSERNTHGQNNDASKNNISEPNYGSLVSGVSASKAGATAQSPVKTSSSLSQTTQKQEKATGLPLGNKSKKEGAPTTNFFKKVPLTERLNKMDKRNKAKIRKTKLLIYGIGALTLVLLAGYFTQKIRSMVAASTTGIRTPDRHVRLDSTSTKLDSQSRIYETEEKNRYQDSLRQAMDDAALGHIVMDWQRLYDIRDKKKKDQQTEQPNELSQNGSLSEMDTLSLLISSLSPQSDSVRSIKEGEGSIYDRNRAMLSANESKSEKNNASMPNAVKSSSESTRISHPKIASVTDKGAPVSKRSASYRSNQTTRSETAYQGNKSDNNPFNTISAASDQTDQNLSRNSVSKTKKRAVSNAKAEKEIAEKDVAENVIVRAVVHGNHKVKSGSKVAFRLLEGINWEGMYFEKNTILIGMADFGNGRISFSNFRSKSLSASTSASVHSVALPINCYDTDMIAGISVQDQSAVETEARRAGSSAVSDAANDLSYNIPYGAVARAASTLTRGVSGGKKRNREMYIDLADNYPVLLELVPSN